MSNRPVTLAVDIRQSSDGEGSVPNLACMFLQLCPADAHERDCDNRCNLPLQGLYADNCHTVTAGFYDAKKLVIVVDCDENKLVCRPMMLRISVDTVLLPEDIPSARLTVTGQTSGALVSCMGEMRDWMPRHASESFEKP